MIVQKKNEERIEYLMRALKEFMDTTYSGSETIDYDETTCDGHCLAQDIIDELGITVE